VYFKFIKFFLPKEFSFSALVTAPTGILVCIYMHYIVWCMTFGSCGILSTCANYFTWIIGRISWVVVFFTSFFTGVSNGSDDWYKSDKLSQLLETAVTVSDAAVKTNLNYTLELPGWLSLLKYT